MDKRKYSSMSLGQDAQTALRKLAKDTGRGTTETLLLACAVLHEVVNNEGACVKHFDALVDGMAETVAEANADAMEADYDRLDAIAPSMREAHQVLRKVMRDNLPVLKSHLAAGIRQALQRHMVIGFTRGAHPPKYMTDPVLLTEGKPVAARQPA